MHHPQDTASSSGEEDDEMEVPIRRSQAGRKNALVDSDDEADEAPAEKPKAPAVKAASKQQAKRKTVLDEDPESDDDWEAPKHAAGAHADLATTCPGCEMKQALTPSICMSHLVSSRVFALSPAVLQTWVCVASAYVSVAGMRNE